jgi:hypothetical protein
MPHDINGNLISVGDIVQVECRVTAVQPGTDYCNLNLETVEPMFPGDYKSSFTLNGKQVFLTHCLDCGKTQCDCAKYIACTDGTQKHDWDGDTCLTCGTGRNGGPINPQGTPNG